MTDTPNLELMSAQQVSKPYAYQAHVLRTRRLQVRMRALAWHVALSKARPSHAIKAKAAHCRTSSAEPHIALTRITLIGLQKRNREELQA